MKRYAIASIILLGFSFSQDRVSYVNNDDRARLSPRLLNYQGYLTDTLGNPITNPSLSLSFTIFDSPSGGLQKWSETQSSVNVNKGIFQVLMGSITPIPDTVFTVSANRWLQLTVGGQVLTPRTRITSSGYAYTSIYSDTAQFARRATADTDWVISGSDMRSGVSGKVGIGTISPGAKLDVAGRIWQTGTGYSVFLGEGAGAADDLTNNYNVFVGYQAGIVNNSGHENTACGYQALLANSTGSINTAVGEQALQGNTTGLANNAIGYQALANNTTGNGNTAVGYISGSTGSNFENTAALGNFAQPTASNRVHIGNTSQNWIGGQVTWSTYSDARAKKAVRDDIPGLAFITQLEPVSFNWDIDKLNNLMGVANTMQWDSKYDIEIKRVSGFLAQDVAQAARQCGYDFSGIDSTADVHSLSYAQFVVPLVKAVQEQQTQIEKQEARIEQQQAEIVELRAMIAQLEEKIK